MKKIISSLVFVSLFIALFSGSLFLQKPAVAQADYNPNNLCTDAGFTNAYALNDAGIQDFLAIRGSFLASYTENGMTAAQIIGNAARANGLSPLVILATLQKEQSLTYMHAYNQGSLDWAMGYGATDSALYTQYKGFNTQVDYGAWQLMKNYNAWSINGSDWNVGKTMTIDSQAIRFDNRCTSSLYRYTPHLHGNSVFQYYFDSWGGNGHYDAKYVTQGPRSGVGVPGVALLPGQQFTIWVNFKNTGTATWSADGPTPVHLGISSPRDHGSPFLGGANSRGHLVQDSVAPGEVGTFYIDMMVPAREGTYVESFQPVVENVGWLDANVSWTFIVNRGMVAAQTNAVYAGNQGPKSGAGSYGVPLAPGDAVTLSVDFLNVGPQVWFKTGNNPIYMGTDLPKDRFSPFLGNRNIRAQLVQDVVLPGQVGTFNVNITAPSVPGTYVEHYRPLMEYVTWFSSEVSWTLTVR